MIFCELREIFIEEINSLLELQSTILGTKIELEIFSPETRDSILKIFQEGGGGYGFYYNEKVVAYALFRIPGTSPDNLGKDIGLPNTELLNVVHIETIVVHPDFRGNSMQLELIKQLEQKSMDHKKSHILCTVSPDNIYSLNNFLKSGFTIITNLPKYGGFNRHILYKKVHNVH